MKTPRISLLLLALTLVGCDRPAQAPAQSPTPAAPASATSTGSPSAAPADNTAGVETGAAPTTALPPPAMSDTPAPPSELRIQSLQPNAVIRSPLVIRGQAPGPWFFEASFPITLVDANGTQLGQTHAQASGEWMTTGMVSFTATLTFTAPTTADGALVFEKDNPSGEAANAGSVRIPVRFAGP